MRDEKTLIFNVLRTLESQGWVIVQSGGNHWKCIPPNPNAPIVVGGSTPSDPRSIKNFISRLRRSGADL